MPIRFDFFVILKVSIKHYYPLVINILCVTYFVTSLTMPDLQTSGMRHTAPTVNDVSAPSSISSPQQTVNSIPRLSFRWRFMKNTHLIPILSYFLVFNLDFIICIDYTRIAASTTATDDVTN